MQSIIYFFNCICLLLHLLIIIVVSTYCYIYLLLKAKQRTLNSTTADNPPDKTFVWHVTQIIENIATKISDEHRKESGQLNPQQP